MQNKVGHLQGHIERHLLSVIRGSFSCCLFYYESYCDVIEKVIPE